MQYRQTDGGTDGQTDRQTDGKNPFINNGRTRRPLTPIKYNTWKKTMSTIDSDNTKENI